MRLPVLAFLLVLPLGALAQEAEAPSGPVLRSKLDKSEAIPGMPLSLRLTVLVPTSMPEPPDWPTLEAPNLLVRLPEGSTRPTSERIGGETWSGITRHYRISPMVPGDFSLPPQEVRVTWLGPDGAPANVMLQTEPVTITGIVPKGAEELDPFLAAEGLTLAQKVEGKPGEMTPGDSVSRSVTAHIRGVSPMFLPSLTAPTEIPGVAVYPDEPVLSETSDRGKLGGTRVEKTTYVAESGGGGSLPEITISWYNTASKKVEMATLEALEFSVDGPPAILMGDTDWQRLGVRAAGALAVLLLAWAVLWRLVPRLARFKAERKAEWEASERYAWGELRTAISARDHAALLTALDLWAARFEGPDPRQAPGVEPALVRIGRARYGRTAGEAEDGWGPLYVALKAARSRRPDAASNPLPPLNPGPQRA